MIQYFDQGPTGVTAEVASTIADSASYESNGGPANSVVLFVPGFGIATNHGVATRLTFSCDVTVGSGRFNYFAVVYNQSWAVDPDNASNSQGRDDLLGILASFPPYKSGVTGLTNTGVTWQRIPLEEDVLYFRNNEDPWPPQGSTFSASGDITFPTYDFDPFIGGINLGALPDTLWRVPVFSLSVIAFGDPVDPDDGDVPYHVSWEYEVTNPVDYVEVGAAAAQYRVINSAPTRNFVEDYSFSVPVLGERGFGSPTYGAHKPYDLGSVRLFETPVEYRPYGAANNPPGSAAYPGINFWRFALSDYAALRVWSLGDEPPPPGDATSALVGLRTGVFDSQFLTQSLQGRQGQSRVTFLR